MVYLVAGHSIFDVGAIGVGSNNESEMTRPLRNLILSRMSRKDVSIDDDTLNTGDVVRWLRNRVKADSIVLDLHFNSFTSPSANGTETFANAKGLALGSLIQAATVKTLGTTDRGMKDVSASARGRIGVLTLPCAVVLLEVCFVSNSRDHGLYIANADRLGTEIAALLDRA